MPSFISDLQLVPSGFGAAEAGRSIVDDAIDVATGAASDASGGAVTTSGGVDNRAIFRQLVDYVEMSSEAAPPVRFSADEIFAAATDPSPNPAVAELKPMLVFKFKRATGLGTKVVAPAGRPDPDAWKQKFAIGGLGLLVVAGGTLGLGYWLGKRKAG